MPDVPATDQQTLRGDLSRQLAVLWQKLAQDPRLEGAIPPIKSPGIKEFEKLAAAFAEVVGWVRHLEKHLGRLLQAISQTGKSDQSAMLRNLAAGFKRDDLAKAILELFESEDDEGESSGDSLPPALDLCVHALNYLYRPSLAVWKGFSDAVNPDLSTGLDVVKQELDPDRWEENFGLSQRSAGKKRMTESESDRLIRVLREVIRQELAARICRKLQELAVKRVNEEYRSTHKPDPSELA
ncbi:MAG: hypothetical protein HY718_21075 [Planctomycetes bacterium]|nr:hypothetical protein [Planctomycetota bacterium]